MNKTTFKLILFLLIILLTIPSLSCKNEDEGLRYGFTTEPTTLDPLKPDNTADGRSILFNVFEGLVKPDTNGTFLPCIGESWTIEQDGFIYNFTIKEGIKFHDGSVVTAEDVKYSIDTAAANGFIGLNNIDRTEITSRNQISIYLKDFDLDFLPYLTVGIVKAGNFDREKVIIGTGPFYIESFTPQRNLILKKFKNYWKSGFPHLDKITIVFFANYDSLMLAFRGGSIDGAFITGTMASQLDYKNFDIYTNRSAAVQLLAINNASYPFDNINVRKAFNYGIDIQGIIDAAFFNHGTPSGSPIIPGLSIYYEDSLSYPYNPELAKTLLKEAGFTDSHRLSFEITVPSNFTMHVDTAQVIADQLEKIDVSARIKLVDWGTWLSDVYFGRHYEATIISLDSPIVSPRSFLSRYYSNNGSNFLNFNSSDFDRLYDESLAQTDDEKLIGLYKEMQKIIADNAASVFIQDILYFIAFSGGTNAKTKYTGALDYPLYVIDFASLYGIKNN
ncbi:MAG: ABC transporter substrate-binding protein [Treponema sp.]|nr:ABC transporter substrate-binding protein [Treponema sp.]MCL2252026.1 ABC transporter substrate-binding protein [Treponema sp.]